MRKLIIAIIAIIIFATIAYHNGWLSQKGEEVYDKTKEAIIEKGKEVIKKGKERIKD